MNSDQLHNDPVDLIVRHLSGEATRLERQQLDGWINADPANKKRFEEYRKSWNSMALLKDTPSIDIEQEWARMEKMMQGKEEGKVIPMQQRGGLIRWMSIAAILLIVAISGITIYYFAAVSGNKIVTGNEIVEKTLPDGSHITLNRNSELQFPKEFKEDQRKIKLKGDAYFEVQPNKEKPFIIQAGQVEVRVLGTSFYVKTDSKTSEVKVIVKEGTVSVTNIKQPDQKVILTEGERVDYEPLRASLLKTENTDPNYLSWKTRRMVFKNKPLSEIIKVINSVYNVEIVMESKLIENCAVTVTFDTQTLEQVLHVLEATIDIQFKHKGDVIVAYGKGC